MITTLIRTLFTQCLNNTPCIECGGAANHRHHVVPKSHGGRATVPLCYNCHQAAHTNPRDAADGGSRAAGRPPKYSVEILDTAGRLVINWGFTASSAAEACGIPPRVVRDLLRKIKSNTTEV